MTPETPERIAALCAPLAVAGFTQALHQAGFSESGYRDANPDLAATLAHFCEFGVLANRRFTLSNQGLSQLAGALDIIASLPIASTVYRQNLLACFGGNFIHAQGNSEKTASCARCDLLTDADISALVATRGHGGQPFFMIGDSHARIYARTQRTLPDGRWLVPIALVCSACSARSLGNPDSRQNAGSRVAALFARIAHHVRDGVQCFFKFGQVDTEYVYPFKRTQRGETMFDADDFETFAGETAGRYIAFLETIVPAACRANVAVCAINPPALSDERWAAGFIEGMKYGTASAQELSNLPALIRAMQIPDIQQRTALHASFSLWLRRCAESAGFGFFDDATAFLQPDGTRIDPQFQRLGGGKDVHIDIAEPAQRIIGNLLAGRLPAFLGGAALQTLLLSSTWRLERPNGDIRARHLEFTPGHGLAGYNHPNEAAWEILGGALVFKRRDGTITSTSRPTTRAEARDSGIVMMQFNDPTMQAHRLRLIQPLNQTSA